MLAALVLSPSLAVAALETDVTLEVLAKTAGQDGKSTRLAVRDGGVLRTGDGLQLQLRSRRDAYVYIIAYGSSNRAALVFPFSGKPEDARVSAGGTRIIPSSDQYLPLDATEGRETLFTIVSDEPVKDIAGLLARMEKQGDNLMGLSDLVHGAYPDSSRLTFKHLGKAPLVGVDLGGLPRTGGDAALGRPATGFDLGGKAFASESIAEPSGDEPIVVGFGSANPSRGASRPADSPPPAPEAAQDATKTVETQPVETKPVESGGGERAREARVDTAARESKSVTETAAASARAGDGAPTEVSAALRRAREQAGVDPAWFEDVVASLPAGKSGNAARGERAKSPEVDVMSAVGDRIRALERRNPGVEREVEQLERQVPESPDADAPATFDTPERSSGLHGDERASIGLPVLPANTQ